MSPPDSQGHTTRPRTYNLTLKGVLAFPLRICNPPPAVAKVRSCGVTPLFKVRLEDVLDRKHLPPLGLKDFEEWLLFVEMSPENLYFTLWLREYRQRYNEWVAQTQFQRELNNGQDFRMHWHPQHSPSLALFYARAKQTFFTPNSPYELNLPSSLLAVFHTSTESPHPDPAIFTDVAIETYRLLDESLRRFVSAQFNNVGNKRVLCGIVAGIIFALIGTIPPLVVNFTQPQPRWTRVFAFPGLFIGLAIMITALNGVCMGVYFFGDLRQLRKFELARPQISKPQPVSEGKTDDDPEAQPPLSSPNVELSHIAKSPSFADARVAHLFNPPSISSHSGESLTETNFPEEGGRIHISEAFFDDSSDFVDVENGVISSNFKFPAPAPGLSSTDALDFNSTAAFIHPFDTTSIEEDEKIDDTRIVPEARQPIGSFDFDALPPRAPKISSNSSKKTPKLDGKRFSAHESIIDPPSAVYPSHAYPSYPYPIEPHPPPSGFLERTQSRCDIKKWRLQTESSQDQIPSPSATEFSSNANASGLPPNPYNAHIIHKSFKSFSNSTTDSTVQGDAGESTESKVKKRFRLMNAVPAFAVPLTRVLSPIVRRGQWEIVVRSGLVALVVSWIVVGCLLAIPEVSR